MSCSSPRTTALCHQRSKRGNSEMGTLTHRLEENLLPVLLLVAVVVCAVIAWLIGGRYEEVATSHGWAEVFRYGTFAGVFLLFALGAVAWATAHAYMHCESMYRMVLLAIFVGVALVLGIALYLFFCRDERTMAFWLVVLVLIAAAVHTYLVWRATDLMGVVAMIPAVVLVLFLLWHFWDDSVVGASAVRA